MYSFFSFCVAAAAVTAVSAEENIFCAEPFQQEVCCERFYLNDVNGSPQFAVSASTSYGTGLSSDRAALFEINEDHGISGWAARTNDVNQWIEADLGSPHYVTGLLLQGRGYCDCSQWVTSFRVLYSNDREIFYSTETMEGNFDQHTVARRFFDRPILARYIRINPLTWNEHITLRFDLLGCRKEEEPEESD